MPGGGFQYDLVLRQPDILQEFTGQGGKLRTGRLAAEFAVSLRGLDQPELTHVAGESDLCRVDARFFQRTRKFVLRKDSPAPDQFEDLPVPIALGHIRYVMRYSPD